MLHATPQHVIDAVNRHLLELRRQGGRLRIEFESVQTPEAKPDPMRLSNAGKCPRQMAYQKLIPEKMQELDARALNVFLLGDLIHDLERGLISVVAPLTGVEEQVVLELDNGLAVPGHKDGDLHLKGGPRVLDIKSTATRGFTDMVNNGPRYDHLCQLNAYMEATDTPKGVLWVYNKDTSHRHAFEVERDDDLLADIKARFTSVAECESLDRLPLRMYEPMPEMRYKKPTGREYLPWQCTYCPFTEECWTSEGFVMVFDKGKPRWIKGAPDEEEVEA